MLAVLAMASLGRVASHGFLLYDDPEYVTGNPQVRAGLTLAGFLWAFTTTSVYSWQPLTWLSHMIDAGIYGLRPAGHHLTSLFLHVASTLLLFLFFRRTTGSTWRSAFTAALFAVHPLHVESVAWVSERKDVLSTFFLMLTLVAYARHAARPRVSSYAAVALFLALGLMSKPMLVTLPLLLLLVDIWPLGRLGPGEKNGAGAAALRSRVIEKIPLFALAAASAAITVVAQHRGGAVKSLELYPLAVRCGNALVSVFRYLGKAVWPSNLAVYYPHPGNSLPSWQVVLAAVALVAATLAVLSVRTRFPYLAVGWLWYLVSLIPVLGLVQVGDQAMADRYTYVPLIGPFVAVVWGVSDLAARFARGRERSVSRARAAAATLVVLVLGSLACVQAGYWRDTETLFGRACRVTQGNDFALGILGDALAVRGRDGEAIERYREALGIHPGNRRVRSNLGQLLWKQGRREEARAEWLSVLRTDPAFGPAHDGLGRLLASDGDLDEGAAHFEAALRSNPDDTAALSGLGTIRARQGRFAEAAVHLRRDRRLRPDLLETCARLAWVLAWSGDTEGAWEEIRLAQRQGLEFPDDLIRGLPPPP